MALYWKNFPSSGRIIYTWVFIRDLDVCLRPEHLAYSKGHLFVFIPEPGHLFEMIFKEDSIYKYIVCVLWTNFDVHWGIRRPRASVKQYIAGPLYSTERIYVLYIHILSLFFVPESSTCKF